MEEKTKVNVKLWAIILFVLIAAILMFVGLYFLFNNLNKNTQVANLNGVNPTPIKVQPTTIAQTPTPTSTQAQNKYYEPTEEEKQRTAQLESILKADLPSMDGSTSTIPLEGGIKAALFGLTQEQAEAGVVHATTYGSYDNLLAGKCDIIFSTPLSENQYQSAEEANVELVEVPVVLEGFVFVVNAKNPVNSLTQQQLKDIYSGKITNWKELGGNDAEIVAYQRNETSGSQNYMKAFMKDSNLMEPKTSFTPASMVGLMDAVATYDNAENSIGYSVYAYAANMYGNGNEIKFIKVDGVEPTKETMASREYPLLNYNYAIYNKSSEETTKVKELTDWLLTYNGQVAMVNAGYVPVKNVKVKELEIEPYTKKGSSNEVRNNTHDDFYYTTNIYDMMGVSFTDYIGVKLDNVQVAKLKNKDLQNTINNFINESTGKLENKISECENYVKLVNESYNKNSKSEIYINYYSCRGVNTKLSCINGYLSVFCSLDYCYNAQSGQDFAYDSYGKIFDLYTGKELSLDELFYTGINFVEEINNQIEKRIPYESELSVRKIDTKRNFNSLPKDGFSIAFGYGRGQVDSISIVFKKNNPYFVEGASFDIDTYLDNLSCIYTARDMADIWEDAVEIEKRIYYPSITNPSQQETEKYEYEIFYLDSHNTSLDSFINNYIDDHLVNDTYITDLENQLLESNLIREDSWINETGKRMISIYPQMYAYKYIRIRIEVGMGSVKDSEVYFDIATHEIVSKEVVSEWGKSITQNFF